MNPIPLLLSKTKLLRGYRCKKYLYLTIHHPQYEAPITPETQALFEQGNIVGTLAREYFKGGILVNNAPWDFKGAILKTRALLAANTNIIYEAAFAYQGCYARADILIFSKDTQKWHLYEVKSTTKIKPEHIDDVGLQVWIMTQAGLLLEKISILHLNPEYRYKNIDAIYKTQESDYAGDVSDLFKEEDITHLLRAGYSGTRSKIVSLFATLQQEKIPEIDIGPYCLQPNECSFKMHCWQDKNLPTMSIFNLPGMYERKWELYNNHLIALDDLNKEELTPLQKRMIEAHQTGKRYLNQTAIHETIKAWEFPLIFLDFETINPAIPRYAGCGPFHHVPFQFSVHVWEHPDAALIHYDYLHESQTDPRPALIPALLQACGDKGCIVAYYAAFESARIEELAQFSPHHFDALSALIPRLVDPLLVIREHVYDIAFAGSFSLKKVAPALLGPRFNYETMDISNGQHAQRAFAELIAPDTSTQRKHALKKAMLAYCKMDTLVMVELVKWLQQICEHSPDLA